MVKSNWIAMLISLFLVLVLELIRLPDMLANARPEWLTLALIYWLFRRPDIAGVGVGFAVGILMDVVSGAYFGIHALAFSIIAYIVIGMYKRLVLFPIIQQSVMVFLLILANLLVVYTFESLLLVPEDISLVLLQAFTSAIVWPFFMVLLDRISVMVR